MEFKGEFHISSRPPNLVKFRQMVINIDWKKRFLNLTKYENLTRDLIWELIWQMFQYEYLLAKIGLGTIENELSKVSWDIGVSYTAVSGVHQVHIDSRTIAITPATKVYRRHRAFPDRNFDVKWIIVCTLRRSFLLTIHVAVRWQSNVFSNSS